MLKSGCSGRHPLPSEAIMSRLILRSLALSVLALSAACRGDGTPTGTGGETPDIRGNYHYSANIRGDIFSGEVVITQQSAGAFYGSYTEGGAEYPVSGNISGHAVAFSIAASGITIVHSGTYTDGNIGGTYNATITGVSGSVQGSFSMTPTVTITGGS
jgi:hypothetical protein